MFNRSGGAQASRAPVLRRVSSQPVKFRGWQRPERRSEDWLLYEWSTQCGLVVLAYPVDGVTGMALPDRELLEKIAPGAAVLAVVQSDCNGNDGPSIEAVDAEAPDDVYSPAWEDLERFLGMKAPFWHFELRDVEQMRAWKPGAETVELPVRTHPDLGPLLAVQEPDGSHAAVAVLDAARRSIWGLSEDVRRYLSQYVDNSAQAEHIQVAARPLAMAKPEEVPEEVLRDGWRTVMMRQDPLAGECVRLGQQVGARDYFSGVADVAVDSTSCTEAAEWVGRLRPGRRTAAAVYLGESSEQNILLDPLTDMPVAEEPGGTYRALVPARLPTLSPLESVTVDSRCTVWIRVQDGTVYLAPQRLPAGNYKVGYDGAGPRFLARLIELLLDDITHPAPDYKDPAPSNGLQAVLGKGWSRTLPCTFTRTELQALRSG